MKYRILRFLLFASAFAWAVSIVAVFLPWPLAVAALQNMGGGNIPDDPMLNYWLRGAAATFTGVGVIFFVVALRPDKYRNIIGLMGSLMFLEGLVMLVYGVLLGLRPFPFYADTVFCMLVGAVIVWLRNEEKD
jgi:peptidoglycan/LPS O-acetylase OafA/YrhL